MYITPIRNLDDVRRNLQRLGSTVFGPDASPTFTGLTLSGLTATRIPFVGTGGLISDDASLLWNNTNKYFIIGSADASDQLTIYHDNSNAQFRTTDGAFQFITDEGTDTNTYLDVMGKGTGIGVLRFFDNDDAEYCQIYAASGRAWIGVFGTNPTGLEFQASANTDVRLFSQAATGETRELKIYGYRTGDAQRILEIGVGVDVNDTASFDGLSNYKFDGNLLITDAGYIGSASDTTAIQIAANGEVTFTDVATGILPTAGVHLATKEYVDLAIGASFDLFLSDTDDAVVANTHVMYQMETGEAQSTEDSAALAQGDNQLAFSWLSEAGVPGTSTLREGIYDCHIHLNRATGNKSVIIYWKLNYVDANGSSNKTLVCTSETTNEITTSEVGYDIHAMVAAEVPLGATKRLLFEVYANVGATGTNAVVTATLEGTHDSHITFQLPSSIWQVHGDVLDDLNTVGQVGADSEFLVGTAAGAFAWESGNTVRTSLGLAIGTNVQAYDAGLASLAGLTYAAASFVKMTGANTFALRTIGETADDLEATIDHDNLANGGAHDYAYISGNDGATGVTAAELEELSDGSQTTLHSHAGYSSRFNAYLSADQNLNTDTWVKVLCNVENFDGGGEYDHTSNYRFTAGSSGYYIIGGTVRFLALGDNVEFWIALNKNNGTYLSAVVKKGGLSNIRTLQISTIVYLAATDFVELEARQESGVTKAIDGGINKTFFYAHRLS